MAAGQVLRLPRHGTDAETDFVLVHVTSDGSRALDLKLIGTENESVFAASLKQNQTSSLKVKRAPCNQEEWDVILAYVLLGTAPDEENTAVVQGAEAVASVIESSMTIIIQKHIEGIKQKLGTIKLPVEERATDDVDLYEWCGQVIKLKDDSAQELQDLKAKIAQQDEKLNKLNENLQELIRTKNEHENELLEKFALLLNEKKLKIRDQQRLLASANVDPEKLAAVEEPRKASMPRTAGASRSGKRKAGKKTTGGSDDESDSGFEKMDIDEIAAAPDSDEDQQETEEETADEDDTPPLPIPAPAKRTEHEVEAERSTRDAPAEEDDEPPPKRELPFAKKPPAASTRAAAKDAEGSETESDDEL